MKVASISGSCRFCGFVLLLGLVGLLAFKPCGADEINPLAPPNTSSPRETLIGFIRSMEERFQPTFGPGGLYPRYMESGRLFFDESEVHAAFAEMRRGRERSLKYLDFSALPAATRDETSWRRCIQLKEILDRMDLPALDQVPDATALQGHPLKRWTLPGSEIQIEYMENGPRAGEYLFSSETVQQIHKFYWLVNDLPYKASKTKGMYDMVFIQPSGVAMFLHRVIPARWFFQFPQWTYFIVAEQTLWKWFFMLILFGVGGGIFWLTRRFSQNPINEHAPRDPLKALASPLSLLLMIPCMDFLLGEILRVTPEIFDAVSLFLWAIFYLAVPWMVWLLGGVVSSWVIQSDRVNTQHVDAQLIRLAARLLSLIIGGAIIVEGANRLGLPAYSVVAGLGIGGLAIALAGQQALANLLGSLIIMIEKPFRVGQTIKTSGVEGVVEDIGFRSTRVRTLDNTLVIIPSAAMINSSIENLSLRRAWRVQRIFVLSPSVPIDTVREFRDEVEHFMLSQGLITQDKGKVTISQMSLDGYELLVEFRLKSRNEAERLKIIQEAIYGIVACAESRQIVLGRQSCLNRLSA